MDTTHFYHAGILARYVAETLFRADAIKRYAGKDATFHIDKADEELKALAEHLGYNLVKREKQQEAA
jgi:hypothetical protein